MMKSIGYETNPAIIMTSLTSFCKVEVNMKKWQLQQAKAQLSDLVKKAQTDGPQEITLHGKPAVVVLAKESYDKLTSRKSFLDLMSKSPLVGSDIDLTRDDSLTREIDL